MPPSPIPSQLEKNAAAQSMCFDPWLSGLGLVGCAAFLFALISYNFVDIDIWHQMALIRESLRTGNLLRQDPFAYTPTIQPWIDHEWGAGALAFVGTKWFGPRLIIVLKFVAAFGTVGGCIFCGRIRRSDFRLITLCAPLSVVLMYLGFFATIRAQAYSFFFTAILLWVLEIDRRGPRNWIAPWLLVFPIWLNLHAGFVVGIGIVALHAVEQAFRKLPWRHLMFVVPAMILEVLINPYGFAYFYYLRRAIFMARPYSPEWSSVVSLWGPLVVAFAIAVLVGLYAVCKAGWTHSQGVPILLATALEGVLHRKLMPLFAIAWLCYVPSYLQRTGLGAWWIEFCSRRRPFLSLAWAAFGCTCLAAGVRQHSSKLSVPQPLYPVGPVLYLQQQKFTGNLLVPFRIGAFISWKLYPAVKVSLDSRYEVAYSDTVMKQIFDFYDSRPGWQSTLEAYPTDAVLLPKDAPVLTTFGGNGWDRVYTDREFAIYTRPGLRLPVEDWSSRFFEGKYP